MSSSSSSAHERAKPAFRYKETPTLKQVTDWARLHSAIYRDIAVAEEFWNCMEAIAWRDKNGHRIRNWRYYLLVWFQNRAMLAAKRNPARFAVPKPVWQQRAEQAEREAEANRQNAESTAKALIEKFGGI